MKSDSRSLCARYNAHERYCRGDEPRWYIPLTDESVCHLCYEALLRALTPGTPNERQILRRESHSFIECDEWRRLWRRVNRPCK